MLPSQRYALFCRATGSLVRDILPRFIGDRRRSVVAVSAAAVILPQTWISSQQQQQQTTAFSSARSKPPTEDKPFVVKSNPRGVRWTPDEDQRLREGVKKFGPLWTKISEALLPHRKPDGCCQRWTHSLDPKVKNGIWTASEDARLTDLVGEYGEGKWTEIAEQMGGRSRIACRQRWTENIDSSLNHGPWSAEEDAVLLKEYAIHPNKWSIIREMLPGRSDLSIFYRHKKLTKPDSDYIYWTDGEVDLLTAAIDKHGSRDWRKVAEDVPGRTKDQCKNRWIVRMAHHGETKDAWSKEDDALLKKGVEKLGTDGKWAAIAEGISGKSAMECKARWLRELSREINTDPWSAEEDAIIKRMREQGKTSSTIIHQLPSRNIDAIKNRCEELGCGINEQWTEEQSAALVKALLDNEGKRKSWKKIAEQVKGKTPQQCKRRYEYQHKL